MRGFAASKGEGPPDIKRNRLNSIENDTHMHIPAYTLAHTNKYPCTGLIQIQLVML